MRRIARVFYCLFFLGSISFQNIVAAPPSPNRVHFRQPHAVSYRIDDEGKAKSASPQSKVEWLKAWPEDGSTNFVQLGSRVVLQLQNPEDLKRLIKDSSLVLSRTIATNLFILQAPDAHSAVQEADRLATMPEVIISYPVTQSPANLNAPYAALPNDQYVFYQWYLEQRNADGTAAGVDLNVRAAWPYSRGEGITIAVADVGIELKHPELTNRATGGPHFNFTDNSTNATPFGNSREWAHGTEAAGLAVAEANNFYGMAGVAHKATLASWVILATNLLLATDEQLMDMYQHQSNKVDVQNHSWTGTIGVVQKGPGLLEQIGISNAIAYGRSGRGSIIVRSAGNDRAVGASVDDDGYPRDPRVIAVGAVRMDGRVTSYSEPGASLLVAAPSGDTGLIGPGMIGLFTTDLMGPRGANPFGFLPPNETLSDYVFDSLGFTGTSASAPQIAGVAALMLAANTNLTYRDAQQILILSSRHFDFADPDLRTNGAGFMVSHNLGFGIPDAGAAVSLARAWTNRPPQTNVTLVATNQSAIPDAGLRLFISGPDVPANLLSLDTAPSVGLHTETSTPTVQLVDVGTADPNITVNLTNRAALIQRSSVPFSVSIGRAARAGAAFAVIYNNATGTENCGGGTNLCPMGATDFVTIPAVFIRQADGENLRTFLQTNTSSLAQIQLASANYSFTVTNALICEHIGVRIQTDHPRRADLRITLVSPQGTRSVLQRLNQDINSPLSDWTYYSTHHFYESSAGTWTVHVSDEVPDKTGSVLSVGLTISGVPIKDTDHDGLDDDWELAHLGTLAYQAKDDPDKDGYNNAREQIMATNPLMSDIPFNVDLSRWNQSIVRLSWPGSPKYTYQLWGGTNVASLNLIANLPGRFPETEYYVPSNLLPHQSFRVIAVENP